MEKARLIKKGKGWIIERSSKGKQIICSWKNIPEEWDGKEVEVVFKSGQPEEIQFEGKVIKKQAYVPQNQNNMRNNYQQKATQKNFHKGNSETAKAPYNFVPLNEKVNEAQNRPEGGHSSYVSDRLSGYIDLSIKAITPLFIRGKDNRFLLLNGKPVIPGSSLRGLTKNLVKIISNGKMEKGEDFEDKTLYKRGTLMEMKGVASPLPGFLYRNGAAYYIRETNLKSSSNVENEFSYSFFSKVCRFSTGKFGNRPPRSFEFIVKTGGKEHITVPSEVKRPYDDDNQRSTNAPDIFKCAKTKKIKGVDIPDNLGMPVFYTLKDSRVFSISHAKYGRIPYSAKISDHIPDEVKETAKSDFAEAIFGTTKTATKVYFEDALINEENAEMGEMQPKILSSPKPTSYQLYLEQGKNVGKGNKDWSHTEAEIRGYKLYWHRKTSHNPKDAYSWTENDGVHSDSHPDKIKAVKPDSTFSGRIRFDNLTEEELGCLLTALQLPENCCHKLGMAKPLGLGSVKIKPTLKIVNRKKRYETLFSNNGWNEAIEENNNISAYQNKFGAYVLKSLQDRTDGTFEMLWNERRMQELKAMLIYDERNMASSDWLEKTSYMELGEFKKKAVLPRPTKIV